MTTIEKIKAEIERLKDENRKIKCQANERYCSGYDDAFYDLVPFIDSLESEKPMLKEARNHFVYNILSGNDMKKMIELYNDEVSCKPGDVVRIIIVKEDGE